MTIAYLHRRIQRLEAASKGKKEGTEDNPIVIDDGEEEVEVVVEGEGKGKGKERA